MTTTSSTSSPAPVTVVHPRGASGSRGHILESEMLDRLPAEGEVVRVVTCLPRLKRVAYGPPEVLGYDLADVGNGQWAWKVVESPWQARRAAKGHSANPYGLDRYEDTFRVQAFDAESGSPVNSIFDVNVWIEARS